MGVFSSKQSKKGKVTDADKAVLSLKTQRRKLTAERTRLEGLIAKGVEEARQLVQAKRRERALLALRKNKLYEQSADKIDAYLLNVEQVLGNIEAAQRTNRLFAALKEGNAAMAALQAQVSLEDVERLNEESAEAKDSLERVQELLSQSLSAQDDAEALQELERIQAAQEAAEAAQLPSVPAKPGSTPAEEVAKLQEELPAVPKHEVKLPPQPAEAEGEAEEAAGSKQRTPLAA